MITAPAQILYDADGNPVIVALDGTIYELGVNDEIGRSLLVDILHELRTLRVIVAVALDSSITPDEVE